MKPFRLQKASLRNTAGVPALIPSPWTEWNISGSPSACLLTYSNSVFPAHNKYEVSQQIVAPSTIIDHALVNEGKPPVHKGKLTDSIP